MADPTAYMIFLVVERPLLLPGDMPMILRSHIPFFMTDLVIFTMQTVCLVSADLTLSFFAVDSPILVVQAMIDFGATGMRAVKTTILGTTLGK